jgi:hypothetical protein
MNTIDRPDFVTDDHLELLDGLFENGGNITVGEFSELYNITIAETVSIFEYWMDSGTMSITYI